MTIKELKIALSQYDENTQVCSGCVDENGLITADLEIKTSKFIGDRDTESIQLVWLGFEKTI